MSNTYEIFDIRVKKAILGLICSQKDENYIYEIYEYNISLKKKGDKNKSEYISFVYDPLKKTFADTDTTYEESYCYNRKNDKNIYIYVKLLEPENLFYSFRDYIDNIKIKSILNNNKNNPPFYILSDESIQHFENVWNEGNPKDVRVFCVKCDSIKCLCGM